MSQYTSETERLLKAGKGYRSEIAFGDKYTDIASVIRHETFVLENIDVPKTILRLYAKDLVKEEKDMVEKLIRAGEGKSLPKTDPIVQALFGDLVAALAEEKTATQYPYCKWITSKDAVLDYYLSSRKYLSLKEKEDTIDEYEIPKGAIVLADTGYDGCLMAFPNDDPGKVFAPEMVFEGFRYWEEQRRKDADEVTTPKE